MSVRPVALLVAALSCAPVQASADPLVRATVHAGFGLPLGSTDKDTRLRTNAAAQIPVGVDVGVRVVRSLIVGVYAQYGAVITKSSGDWTSVCPVADDCTGTDTHVGVQAHYHFSPAQGVDPWVGMGIGYEWYSVHATRARYTWRGIEIANLEGGADFSLGRAVSVGPFLGVSVGQFSKLSVDPASAGFGGPLENTGIHEWFSIGARGSVDFL